MEPPNPDDITMNGSLERGKNEIAIDTALHPTQSPFMKAC